MAADKADALGQQEATIRRLAIHIHVLYVLVVWLSAAWVIDAFSTKGSVYARYVGVDQVSVGTSLKLYGASVNGPDAVLNTASVSFSGSISDSSESGPVLSVTAFDRATRKELAMVEVPLLKYFRPTDKSRPAKSD